MAKYWQLEWLKTEVRTGGSLIPTYLAAQALWYSVLAAEVAIDCRKDW
jgi:hypothetical protein